MKSKFFHLFSLATLALFGLAAQPAHAARRLSAIVAVLSRPFAGPSAATAGVARATAEIKREPAIDMPLPPIPARPRETRPAIEKRMPEMLRKPPAERGPAILKSGVIDGMPYTLYANGSIEAQLPQGMVKFASVDAFINEIVWRRAPNLGRQATSFQFGRTLDTLLVYGGPHAKLTPPTRLEPIVSAISTVVRWARFRPPLARNATQQRSAAMSSFFVVA